MNQQDKNTEILRLLNCLEPYKSEFQSMNRDIEFAFQMFGKWDIFVLFFIKFYQKKKRIIRRIILCDRTLFQAIMSHLRTKKVFDATNII